MTYNNILGCTDYIYHIHRRPFVTGPSCKFNGMNKRSHLRFAASWACPTVVSNLSSSASWSIIVLLLAPTQRYASTAICCSVAWYPTSAKLMFTASESTQWYGRTFYLYQTMASTCISLKTLAILSKKSECGLDYLFSWQRTMNLGHHHFWSVVTKFTHGKVVQRLLY